MRPWRQHIFNSLRDWLKFEKESFIPPQMRERKELLTQSDLHSQVKGEPLSSGEERASSPNATQLSPTTELNCEL